MTKRLAAYLLLAWVAVTGCSRPSGRIRVVASTTLISTIVQSIGGDRFAVTTIAPAGFCPGQFDLRPSDIAAANNARLIMNHSWEAWYPKLVKAIIGKGPRRTTLATPDNWMVPEVQKQAADEIAALLAEVDPARADTYRLNVERYKADVDSAAAAAKARLAGLSLPPVISCDLQAQQVRWFGFRVIATYGRPEDFTASGLTELARVAQDSGVKLVVDNLQSGPDAGRPLAEALRIRHAVLTNFPLGAGYAEALLANADTLAKSLR